MTVDLPTLDRVVPLPPIAVRGLVEALLSVVVNAVLLALGRAVLPVPPGFEPLQWRPVLVTSAAGALGGAVVYGFLDRVTERPDRVFLAVATLVLVASFVPLVTDILPQRRIVIVGLVGLLHVLVAVVTVVVLVGRPVTGTRSRG